MNFLEQIWISVKGTLSSAKKKKKKRFLIPGIVWGKHKNIFPDNLSLKNLFW